MVGSIGDNMPPPRRHGKRKVAPLAEGCGTYSVKHGFRFQRDTAVNQERRDILYGKLERSANSVSAGHSALARKPNKKAKR
jgi:hypothetical protein